MTQNDIQNMRGACILLAVIVIGSVVLFGGKGSKADQCVSNATSYGVITSGDDIHTIQRACNQ